MGPVAQPVPAGASELLAGRYSLHRSLKRANGVETFLADDVVTGTTVVVKTVEPRFVPAAARLRFEHETAVLRTLGAAGAPALHDAGQTAEHLYLVQRLVPGRPLDEVLRDGPLPLRAALSVGVEIAGSLEVAHAAGVFHRDVKPANVLVDGPHRTGGPSSVVLVDFGFARSASLDASIRDELVGTVRYLSPEAAGLLAAPVDERSDLYSLGVLLFECLAGRPPFVADGVGDLLRQHLSAPVPDLHDLGVSVPRSVQQVLERLLGKEPAERYQSAAAVVGDLLDLAVALDRGDPEPRLLVGRLDHRRTLTDPSFVGRDQPFRQLQSRVAALRAGRGGLVLLDAESGAGKTRLLTELTHRAVRDDVTVLRGQGVAQVGQRPFALLQGVADGLVALLADDLPEQQRLRRELGDAAGAAVLALPALHDVLGAPRTEGGLGPEQFGMQRSAAALARLLAAAATPERPLLLALDDVQWADALTVQVLETLFADGAAAAVLVVAAFRTEEVAAGSPVRALPHDELVVLGPLDPPAVAELAASMAGPLPDPAVATVVRLADGSPFLASAVLRGLVESGALVPDLAGWTVDERALERVQTARRSAALLVQRLERLDEPTLGLLSVGAVLGKAFDIETAVHLTGDRAGTAFALETARSRRLLWIDERSGRCTFFHDKIREALLERLDDDARRALHARAGVVLQQAPGPETAFDVAYHLDAAGQHDAARPFAVTAAELSRERHALDAAAAHYRMALTGLPPEDCTGRARIAEGLGDVLTLQGAYAEAERELAVARSLAEGPVAAAALDGKLGDLAFKQGELAAARTHLEGALARLGRRVPRSSALLVLLLLWEVLVQAAHTVLPRRARRRPHPRNRERDLLAMRLHSRLTYLNWFASGTIACAWSHLRGLNLAERYPPSPELGQAWSEHAPVMTMLPWYGRAIRYALLSHELRRDLGDVWGQGQSLGFSGVALYAASELERAADACREAGRLLEQTGDRWEVNTAAWNLALCQYRSGDLAGSAQTAGQVLAAAIEIGDQASVGIALSIRARALGGDVDPALLSTQLARGDADAHTASELHLAAALHARRTGDLTGALAHLDRARAVVRSAGLRQEYVAPVPAWRATVLREIAEQIPPHAPATRDARLRAAARATRSARWWAAAFRNNAPHALREAGLVHAARRHPRRARRLLTRSVAVADLQGARYEAALSRLALSRLTAPDDSTAVLEAAHAVRLLEPQEPAVAADPRELAAGSVSLFDRFTTLLAVGRSITAATTYPAVEDAVRQAAVELLRGERCHLVRVDEVDDEPLTTRSGEPVDLLSGTLLRRAVEEGTPVVVGEATADGSESLLLSGLRSVLAAPVQVHGEPVLVFYVTHGQVGGLFGDEERQLAAFVATLAGASLEHLAGSESRFRCLVQGSSDVVTLVDRDGRVTYQSDAAGRVFGLPPAGLIGQDLTTWVHPADRDAFTAALARAAAGHETRVECRVRHDDGAYRWAESVVTDLLDQPVVGALVLNTRDVTERRRLEDELRERAQRDSLTGLPNRALFLDRARASIQRAAEQGVPAVVAFLDLDDFKAVNDTFGHRFGDELLQLMADRLTACLRPGDTISRLGGDEFALLLEDADLSTAEAVVERILASTSRPLDVGSHTLVVHTSIGLAPAVDAGGDPDQLLAHADAAMYSAKARGKDGYAVFVPAMQAASETRSRLRTEIDRALTEQQFCLRYQPIVSLRTGRRTGVEALVRWQHPQRGLLSPAEFMDYAEQSAQVVDLGRWVLGQACTDLAGLGPDEHMSINVSARQLQDPSLLDDVQQVLTRTGVPASRVMLEITETATVTDTANALRRLTALKELGVLLALDDFGTGYSPLSYLRRFPVDVLKIDQSFVRNLTTDRKDAAIVRGVVQMAHDLGLFTVAEGVEEVAQLDVLHEIGCDLAQGYLWLRPSHLEDVPEFGTLPHPRRAGDLDRPRRART